MSTDMLGGRSEKLGGLCICGRTLCALNFLYVEIEIGKG